MSNTNNDVTNADLLKLMEENPDIFAQLVKELQVTTTKKVKKEKVKEIKPDYVLRTVKHCKFCSSTNVDQYPVKWNVELQKHTRCLSIAPVGLEIKIHQTVVDNCPDCEDYLLSLEPILLAQFILHKIPTISKTYLRNKTIVDGQLCLLEKI